MQTVSLDEGKNLDASLQEYEQGESDFSFCSVMRMTTKMLRVHDMQISNFCMLPKTRSTMWLEIYQNFSKYHW